MRPRRWLRNALGLSVIIIGVIFGLMLFHGQRTMPAGLSYLGTPRTAGEIQFLADLTYTDNAGVRRVEHEIFDSLLRIIEDSRRFVVLDMFLYNPFQGSRPETTRLLSAELTEALIAHKRAFPAVEITLITDPINTVYGGIESDQFRRLADNGIRVVITRLEELRDSNPVFSSLWRTFAQPFGNEIGSALPNPFGAGRVSVRSYLSLLNFKANHRKTIVADQGAEVVGLVSSGNPHDASSAHSNVAVRFTGNAALDLLETENAVLRLSGAEEIVVEIDLPSEPAGATVQVITEGKIKDVMMDAITAAAPGDSVNVAMFYLSDRDVVGALKNAQIRNVRVRVLLDPNRDAFGLEKNGVPNRPVANELRSSGIQVRWCDTHGEQCHGKMLLLDYADGRSILIAGSANITRRNLDDLNLETNVAIRGDRGAEPIADAREFFDLLWENEPKRHFSTDYEVFADESLLKLLQYRVMEATGMSTF